MRPTVAMRADGRDEGGPGYFAGGGAVVPDGAGQTLGQSTKRSLPDVVSLQTLQTSPVSRFGAATHEAPPEPAGEQVLEAMEPSGA
jgi:hypothetical protein